MAVSFIPYLIGSLSEDLFTRAANRVVDSFGGSSVGPVSSRRDRSASPAPPPPRADDAPAPSAGPPAPSMAAPSVDAPEVQVQLQAVQAEVVQLGNAIERMESENALRLALLPPLVVLGAYLTVRQDALWALSLLLMPAFILQAVDRQRRIQRDMSSRDVLIQTAQLEVMRLSEERRSRERAPAAD